MQSSRPQTPIKHPRPQAMQTLFSRREFVLAATTSLGLVACSSKRQEIVSTDAQSSKADGSQQAHAQGDGLVSSEHSELTSQKEMDHRSFFALDTICVVGGKLDQELLDELEKRCLAYEALFSSYIDESDVSRLNAAGGKPVELHLETADLISKALGYCEKSAGLFDITIGAVSQLWDFHTGFVPSDEAIAEAIKHVDYRLVLLDGQTCRLTDPAARLDLGGIAKGYIADKLREFVREQGVESAYVNLGGNVCVLGSKPDGSAWNVGVRDPSASDKTQLVTRVKMRDKALVTSGLYERSFEQDKKRYWHILDPRTGYPVQTDLVSASVLSTNSIDGDGYTKALFMLDPQAALNFLEAQGGLQGFFVMADGSTLSTPGSDFGDES